MRNAMADPLSITAGVVGLLAFAGSTLTKGYSILQSLHDSKSDVERLLIELSQLTGILVAIEAQEKEINKRVDVERREANAIPYILESSVSNCRKMVERVWDILEKLEKSRRAVLAIKWQFLEPDVKKSIQGIEHYKIIFILCLGVDVRCAALKCRTLPLSTGSADACWRQQEEDRSNARAAAEVIRATRRPKRRKRKREKRCSRRQS